MSAKLEINPRWIWKVGDPRKTPSGKALQGVYPDSYWSARMMTRASSTDQDLAAPLGTILDELSPKKDLVVDFPTRGGKAEFFIGWFFDEGNSGEVLGHALLRRLADFCIDLSFDVYQQRWTTKDGGGNLSPP
jgi:hypothetical protein